MRIFALAFCLGLFSLPSIAQSKVDASAIKTDYINDKANVESTSTKEVKRSAATNTSVSTKRIHAPKNKIERTPEMLNRKKKAPLLNEPQH